MTAKRNRTPKAKPGELLARWGRVDRHECTPQIVYAWGAGGADKPDGRLLSYVFEDIKVHGGKSLAKELEERGYDLTTLRFSIKQKQ